MVNEILSKLNESQIKPVLATEGAVLVIAGAGSGKTRVLTNRIAYLIKEKGVKPHEILAITFTNKAADEMKVRLENLVGSLDGMWASTIHSMCVKILRSNIGHIGYEKNFSIYNEEDKEKAISRKRYCLFIIRLFLPLLRELFLRLPRHTAFSRSRGELLRMPR